MSFVPFGTRTMFVRPMSIEAETKSGILVVHHRGIATIYARVTAVHPSCRNVRVGDWVLHLPNRLTRCPARGGAVYVLDERLVLGIVDPGDGGTWFLPERG